MSISNFTFHTKLFIIKTDIDEESNRFCRILYRYTAVTSFLWSVKTMGYSTNGYNAYRETGVKTASQGKLIVMLYEEAVRQLEKSITLIKSDGSIEPQQIENFSNSLQKVEDILTELQVSLDMDKGGEIAKNLMSLYVYFNKELLEVTMSHDKKKLAFILDMLSQLRDAWIIAANSTANAETKLPADRPALNITG